MCTLAVARDIFPGAPLVIVANRDEFLSRPSARPRLWRGERIPFVAPRDLEAGGSWLGVNAHRLFVAITNSRKIPSQEGKVSRGGLVVKALGYRKASHAAEAICALDGSSYNGFHLVIADGESAFIVWGDGKKVHRSQLGPGIFVVTEAGFEGQTEREKLVSSFMRGLPKEPPSIGALEKLTQTHAEDPFDGVCNHADSFGYGTKSSTILKLLDDDISIWHCDERPCEGSFKSERALAQELLRLGR